MDLIVKTHHNLLTGFILISILTKAFLIQSTNRSCSEKEKNIYIKNTSDASNNFSTILSNKPSSIIYIYNQKFHISFRFYFSFFNFREKPKKNPVA